MVAQPSVQSPLRRGLKALAVFGVVLFLFGGSVGFVQATDDVAEVTKKDLVLIHPSVGQMTTYSIEFHESPHVRNGMVGPLSSIELTDRMPIRFQDGSLRQAFVVEQSEDGQTHSSDLGRRSLVDPETMHMVAFEYEQDSMGPDDGSDQAWYLQVHGIRYVGHPTSPLSEAVYEAPNCLHKNLFLITGATTDLRGPVACSLPERYKVFQNSSGAEIIGWTTIGSEDAFQVRITDEDNPADHIDIWYLSGVPGAAQVAYSLTHTDERMESATIRLDDYKLGDPELSLMPTIIEPPLPPIGFNSWDGHWPDDSDFDVPFRLVDAMEIAMTLPTSDLPRYLEEHPEAYAFMFVSFHSEVDGSIARNWFAQFRADQPTDGLTVWVSQQTVAENSTDGLSRNAAVYQVHTKKGAVDSDVPHPSQRPESFPSFKDTMDWAEVYTDGWGTEDFGEPSVIGFIYSCLHCDVPAASSLEMGTSGTEYSNLAFLPLNLPGDHSPADARMERTALWTIDGTPIGASAISFTRSDAPPPESPESMQVRPMGESVSVLETFAWTTPTPAATGISLGVAVLTGLTYYVWPFLKQFLGMGLFSRLRRPTLLDHPARQSIHDAIRHDPGIRFGALAERTGLANGTMRHHLNMLVDVGLITRKETNGFTCYFAPQDATPENTAKAGAVQSDGARTVMEFITEHPGTTARSITEATGLAIGTVGYHVKRLRDAGLVGSERDGRRVRLIAE